MSAKESLQQRIGYTFKDSGLLDQALVHPSHDASHKGKAFQRLEFLGDRVLGLVIAEKLYHHFPREQEGELAKRLAALVCREACHRIAQDIDLKSALSIDTGELYSHGSVLADALEALIGAIYLDAGVEAAQGFVLSYWQEEIQTGKSPPSEPKTALQEWVQRRMKKTPHYETLAITGADHAPTFHVRVSVEGYGQSEATGPTRKHAEQASAKLFLERFCNDLGGCDV
ncbi:MAG: ribonuclease III [Alphaproteobacteria bacterium]